MKNVSKDEPRFSIGMMLRTFHQLNQTRISENAIGVIHIPFA